MVNACFSGHRIGTAEVESAIVLHPDVAEAAVVGFPHPVKGEGIYIYATLNQGVEPSDELLAELKMQCRKEIGAFASPDVMHWAPALPKTLSSRSSAGTTWLSHVSATALV